MLSSAGRPVSARLHRAGAVLPPPAAAFTGGSGEWEVLQLQVFLRSLACSYLAYNCLLKQSPASRVSVCMVVCM